MSSVISVLRDDFVNGIIDPVWAGSNVSGSATKAETGGQAVLTLPSSTAGSHVAAYQTIATYDLTSDQFVWNIQTMVATGVAATAYFQLLVDAAGTNQLYWRQVSNAITARTVVAGVDTQLFTATWSASTYKYLRIRESAGTIFWDSSTNGTTWTARAALANPFAVTSLYVQFAVTGGNIASPGSLKLDDVNLILPALSTTWHWTQDEWPLLNRFRPITLAIDTLNTVQGYIAVASSIDSSGNLVSPVYYSGPIGSASGGYLALTLASSQANAQAMAVNLPLDGRWDLPSIVECRFIRLYHRSIDGSSYIVREFYPRRLVQTDDIEAESIQAINIAAGTITADKITVLNLAALSEFVGQLSIDTTGWIYQGTGTGSAPTTGLKIFNSGGIGKLSTYNAGVEQVTLDTDGSLKAGAGKVLLSANGIEIDLPSVAADLQSYQFTNGGATKSAVRGYLSGVVNYMDLQVYPLTTVESQLNVFADGGTSHGAAVFLRATGNNGSKTSSIEMDASSSLATIAMIAANGTTVNGPLLTTDSISPPRSGGSAVFALDGTSKGSAITVLNTLNATIFSNARVFSGLLIISETAVNGNAAMFLIDGGGTVTLIGTAGATWSVTSGTASKTNVYLVAGVVTIENRLGSTAVYNVMALRTRTS